MYKKMWKIIKNNKFTTLFYLVLGLFPLVLNFLDHFNILNKVNIFALNLLIWIIEIYLLSGIYYSFYVKIYLKGNYIINQYIVYCNRYFIKLFKTDIILGFFKIIFLIPFFLISVIYNNSNIFLPNIVRIFFISFYSVLTIFAFPFLYIKDCSGEKALFLSIKYILKYARNSLSIFIVIFTKFLISISLLYISIKINNFTFNYWLISILTNLSNNFFNLLLFLLSIIILKEQEY